MMENDQIKTDWSKIKTQLKQEMSRLSFDDLVHIISRRYELKNRLKQVYIVAVDEAEKQFDEFRGSLKMVSHDQHLEPH